MKIKTMGDIMLPLEEYPFINHRDTLLTAIEELDKSQMLDNDGRCSMPRVLLVFDDINQLVGTVRRRDILRGLEPKFLSGRPMTYREKLFDVAPDPNLTEIFSERIVGGMRERVKLPVTEVMAPVEMWVDYEDRLGKAIYEMVGRDIHLLPVIKGDRVVGVVRTVDLLSEIHRLIKG